MKSLIARTWLQANSTRDASSIPSLISVSGINVPPSCDSAHPGCSLPIERNGERKPNREYYRLFSEGVCELHTIIGIEIDVTACLWHSIAGYLQQEEAPCVRVNDVDKHSIGWVETNLWSHALEVRFGRIESSDSTNSRNSFGRIRSGMCSQRMPDQMNVFRAQIMLLLQFLDQECDFQTN